MQPTSSRPGPILATPAWLTTRVGRAAACTGIAAIAVEVCTGFGWLSPQVGDGVSALLVMATAGYAIFKLCRLCRTGGCPNELRRFWRTLRVAMYGAAIAAVLGASSNPLDGALGETVRTLMLFASVFTLGGILRASARIPGGEISRPHRVIASIDLTTLMIAGLTPYFTLAVYPVINNPPADEFLVRALGGVALIGLLTTIAILLLSTIALMPFRSHEAHVARGLKPFAEAVVALVATGVIPYCVYLARDGFAEARPSFVGWTLLALGIGLHARGAHDQTAASSNETPSQVRVAMPYAAIGLLVVLIVTLPITKFFAPTKGLASSWDIGPVFFVALFAAFILVLVRQTVIARENFGMVLEMQRAKDIAESANNARLQFLANISHDLRTPLNGVLGCAQILLREKTMGSKQKDLLKTIQGCGEHLRNLINDLLDLSKLEADKLELAPSPFDLKGLLAALMKTFALEAENKKIVLELEQAPELPDWIQCDRKRLQQILGNLVHNAIKFTDHGRVKVRARVNGPALIFEVIDTGCGIMPDKINELFQPFHVVDERSIKLEGTGLGLSICKKLANKMGGDIAVSSKLGKGSTFTVVVPLKLAMPVVEVQRTVVDYQGRRRRVLIVDDNAANRVVLRTMLEPLDFLIHEADSAAAAHEQISLAHPDIVLMDLMMPGTDGFALCRQILDMDILRMPVLIAVSALAGEDVLEKCRKTGFADLLNKPVHLDALVESLRAHAGIEWTYGVLHPAPIAADETPANEPIIAPPAAEVSAFLDLARRGVVRNIETRAEQLAHTHPEFTPFARRVARYARDFKLKELGEWLSSLTSQQVHGSA